jgi:hypothetical protein
MTTPRGGSAYGTFHRTAVHARAPDPRRGRFLYRALVAASCLGRRRLAVAALVPTIRVHRPFDTPTGIGVAAASIISEMSF